MKKVKKYLLSLSLVPLIVFNPIKVEAKLVNRLPLEKGQIMFNAFVFDEPSWQSNRIGEVNFDDIIDIYTEVTNNERQESFMVINYEGKIAYVPHFSVEKIDVYSLETIPSEEIKNHTFVDLEGNIRKEAYDDMMKAYKLIPENIRLMYQIEGFKIKMTEKYIADEAFGDYGGWNGTHLNGAFDYEKKILFVNDENGRHIIHEIGHYVNDKLKMFSDRPENKEIFKKEASKVSIYSETNQREYFAECFSLYFRYPQYLKKVSPNSYDLIERALDEFNVISKDIVKRHFDPLSIREIK